jgi:hypothetical protein
MTMTFTNCEQCKGKLAIFIESKSQPGWFHPQDCPCTRGKEPGWNETGLTMGQIERMADVERALQGDPGIPPERRNAILDDLERRLEKARGRQ